MAVETEKQLMMTIVFTISVCWAFQEILERKFNLFPNVISTKHLELMAKGRKNHDEYLMINKRLTKTLDINGTYRIQTRGSVYFIKCVWQFILFIAFFVISGINPQWFTDHFIYLKDETVNHVPYLHVAASIVGFYSWEVITNRYGKLQWSVLIHHWCTVGIAFSILLGAYSPFATWYGFSMTTMSFPVFFSLGFRGHFSNLYPILTRKLMKFSYYLLTFDMIVCLVGQIYIILNSLLFHYNESIHVEYIVVMIILICIWLYDDIALLKALKAFSLQNYEHADVLNNDRSIMKHMELEIVPKTSTELMRVATISATSTTPTSSIAPNSPNTPTTPASNDEICTL